ncbi:MAG: hypothetical protein R6U01_04935 [Halorubrum sp.]|uniref:hypothetical protein n=1 Tax=Halorubrum sp. TaxID=1879286 RepID=UPI003970BE9A
MEPNEHDRTDGFDVTDINRRKLLQGVGAAGAIGVLGTGSAAADSHKPCFKEFNCDDLDDSTYVKIEFVTETDDDGNITDCYFEEETDTGLVEIVDYEIKEDEDCEPISVEWEFTEDSLVARKIMAFGGGDCDTVTGPGLEYNAERDSDDDDAGLENDAGNTAAISNLQFCLQEVEDLDPEEVIDGNIGLSYEDLPRSQSDWDVNDLVVDLNPTFRSVGTDDSGNERVVQFTFDIIPQARGAADDHEWRLDFPSDSITSGTYNLEVKDSDNNSDAIRDESGSFDGSSDVPVTIFPSTAKVFDDLENAEEPENVDGCTLPNEWATLVVEFDEPVSINVPREPADLDVNADNLFFNPVLKNLDESVTVDQGDVRLVAVPDTWEWPLGAVAIWDAYDDVSEGSSGGVTVPSYDSDAWYDSVKDEDLVANCNFEPTGDGGLEEVSN